ncbi:hypothetical protein ABZP36_013491 [Zizania latifolia]
MAKLYVQAVPPADLNKNTEWFMYPGVWTTYILILFFSWLLVLSVGGCTPGMAWTLVNLAHFASDDEREMCARTIYCTNIDKKVCYPTVVLHILIFFKLMFLWYVIHLIQVYQADVKLFFESICGEVYRLRLLGDYHHSTRIAFVEFVMVSIPFQFYICLKLLHYTYLSKF